MKKAKKLMVTLLVATLFISTLTVHAAEYENISIQLDDNTGINPDDYEAINTELMTIGRMARRAIPSKTLSLVHYYQAGEDWSNDIMQRCGQSIKDSGCTLTSFTMIANYFGSTDDPGEVNERIGSSACPFSYGPAGEEYGLTIHASKHAEVSDNDAINFIIGAIVEGKPVLVGVHKDSGSGTHFVAAYGYSGSTIYINDPASRNYATLDKYLEDHYVHRLYVYTN